MMNSISRRTLLLGGGAVIGGWATRHFTPAKPVLGKNDGADAITLHLADNAAGLFRILSDSAEVPGEGELELYLEYSPAAVGDHSARLVAGSGPSV